MENGETMEITEETQPVGTAEKLYHHVIKTPLRDESGNVIGLQGMFWDITEKIRAEEQIRRTTAELARSREELRAKNQLMEENLHMAREIQLTMLPQQYPTFPRNVPPEQSALPIRASLPARRNRQRRFLQRLAAFGLRRPACSSATWPATASAPRSSPP